MPAEPHSRDVQPPAPRPGAGNAHESLASRLGLSFQDPSTEAEFWEQLYRRRRIALIFGVSLITILIPFMSAWFVPHAAQQMTDREKALDLLSPLVTAGLPLLVAGWRMYRQRPWRHVAYLFSAAAFFTGLGYSIHCAISGRFFDFYSYSIAHVLLLSHLFLVIPLRHLLLGSPAVVLTFTTVAFTVPAKSTDAVSYAIAFVTSLSFVLLYAAFAIERIARQNFNYENALRREYANRQEGMRSRERWLTTMSQFLRDELGNALTGVRSVLQRMRRSGVVEEQKIYQQRAEDSAVLMQRLLAEAGAANSLEAALASITPVPVDLGALLQRKAEDYRAQFPRVQFEVSVAAEFPLEADADRLTQALDKLINNAVEHTDHQEPIRLSLARSDVEARIIVRNSGPTISDPETIFERDTTTQRSADNLGLGLFVVKRIAAAHGGNVTARSVGDPRGAEFVIHLPIAS